MKISTDIYACGSITNAGTGISIMNSFAKFSNGSWSPVSVSGDLNLSLLASYGSILYYAQELVVTPIPPGSPLPIGAIDTATGNSNAFPSIPLITKGDGYIEAIYADEDYVYVGGDFQVSASDGTLVNNRIFLFLYYFLSNSILFAQ